MHESGTAGTKGTLSMCHDPPSATPYRKNLSRGKRYSNKCSSYTYIYMHGIYIHTYKCASRYETKVNSCNYPKNLSRLCRHRHFCSLILSTSFTCHRTIPFLSLPLFHLSFSPYLVAKLFSFDIWITSPPAHCSYSSCCSE